jgi:hypothetical protein
MSIYNTYKSAGDALTKGVWLAFSDTRVKVRYAGRENKGYVKCLRALTAPYDLMINNGIPAR